MDIQPFAAPASSDLATALQIAPNDHLAICQNGSEGTVGRLNFKDIYQASGLKCWPKFKTFKVQTVFQSKLRTEQRGQQLQWLTIVRQNHETRVAACNLKKRQETVLHSSDVAPTFSVTPGCQVARARGPRRKGAVRWGKPKTCTKQRPSFLVLIVCCTSTYHS